MPADTPVLLSVVSHQASVLQVVIMGLIIISTILAASAPISDPECFGLEVKRKADQSDDRKLHRKACFSMEVLLCFLAC